MYRYEKNSCSLFAFLMADFFSGSAEAQTKQVYNDFSRWSLGLNGGISIFRGDMVSFSADKTYLGRTRWFTTGLPVNPDFRFVLDSRYGTGERECQEMGERVQDLPDGGVLLRDAAGRGFRLL